MIHDCCLGIDTSCYTTSIACVSEKGIVFSERTMLSVPFGKRGLRQSEALFQHVKNLAPLVEHLFEHVERERIGAVAVSSKPTGADESYMPVFLAGLQTARSIAAALQVPLLETTHQSGHFRAALVENEKLLGNAFYGFHLSGGTTDLVQIQSSTVEPYNIQVLGTSTDLHCGQFVDRIGVLMGLPFPAGRHLEQLAVKADKRDVKLAAAVKDGNCSFSGAEAAAARILDHTDPNELAYGVYDCIARTISKMLDAAMEKHGEYPVLLCGGVASSQLLREMLKKRYKKHLYFGKPELSSDNAVGVAYYGMDRSALWKN